MGGADTYSARSASRFNALRGRGDHSKWLQDSALRDPILVARRSGASSGEVHDNCTNSGLQLQPYYLTQHAAKLPNLAYGRRWLAFVDRATRAS